MTAAPRTPLALDAAWLNARPTQAVFSTFAAAGFTARAVGGIVRNTLLGRPTTDIDLATDAHPHDTMRIAEAAGFKTIPTGLAHGTVTVIASGTPFEITTLRRDVATDGRHAEVAFTSDWAIDASRRDFTINALYCDADGTLFDPLGGLADLEPVRLRFIGNPVARIAEDYLRILRFFRFTATFVEGGVLDAEGLAACVGARAGLAQISGERIQAELLKLLAAPEAAPVTRALVDSGVFASLASVAARPADLARLIAIEDRLALPPDPLRRLAALAVATPQDAAVFDARLKLANRDRTRFTQAATNAALFASVPDEPDAKVFAYRLGLPAFKDGALIAWARSGRGVDDAAFHHLATLPGRFTPPGFPLSGGDLIALGLASGPQIGDALDRLESHWLAHGFTPDRDGLLALAKQWLPGAHG